MSNAVSRARTWALLGLLAHAPLAASQTMEIVTGAGRYVDAPGTSVPVAPNSIGRLAFGADGMLYLSDINSKMLRFNPATGTATALPANDASISFNLGYTTGIAFDSNGAFHVSANGHLLVVDPDLGTTTDLGFFAGVEQMAFAADGTLYYVSGDSRVWARQPSGATVVVAGLEEPGFAGDGGPALNAQLDNVRAIAVSPAGDLYVADTGNHRIRRISLSDGLISTFAGTGATAFNGDGLPAQQTNLASPDTLALDAVGNLYVGDNQGRIRRIDALTGLVSTAVGSGLLGETGDGGAATAARIVHPHSLALDAAGNLYFSDYGFGGSSSRRVRRVDASTGIITKAIGNNDSYYCGEGVAARAACFGTAYGLDIDAAGDLLITDTTNRRLRKVTAATNQVSTVTDLATVSPLGVEHDAAGSIYVATYGGYRVFRIPTTGGLLIYAGNGNYGFSGDGSSAIFGSFAAPTDVALDAAGNLYIADQGNNRIRRVDAATQVMTTFVSGIAGPATIEFDAAGNLLVAGEECRLRSIAAGTNVVTTIAGTGVCAGQEPPGGALATATKIGTYSTFARAPDGSIYLAWGSQLYRIDTSGTMSRVPAPAAGLATFDGVHFTHPGKMEFDAAGRLYLTDSQKPYVFRISGLFDSTPPTITPQIVGTAGSAGWYRSNVQLSWAVSDAESSVSSSNGCTATSVTEDTAGVTFTCTATSIGGTATQSVTLRRDTVAPTLTFGAASPAADEAGWNSTPVSIPFDASDALSGVYSSSSANPLLITDEGAGLTAQVIVTDYAGNSATFTPPAFNIDRLPPVVTSSISGTLGSNGWYTSSVQVSWSHSDEVSPIRATEGCDTRAVVADTSGATFTCTATSAGGTTTQSITIKRDATPPQLVFGAPSPAPNPAGWNNSDVTFSFNATDATAGVTSTSSSSPVVVSGQGANLSIQVVVTDGAGNSATFATPAVSIDRVPPTVTPIVNGVLGSNGWHTSDVQVSWNIDEIPASILGTSGCGTQSVTADTAGITFTCVVDSTGGTASGSVTVQRDATAPILTFGSATPVPNANGWNKTNVSVPFTRSDALSGLASTSATSPLIISAEGAGVTGQVVVTDRAGNVATFTSMPRNIDKTAPAVAITSPANAASYGFYQDVRADFSCTDLSLSSCVGTTPDGEPVNTRSAGARTFKVTGKDLVNFTTAVTSSFTVESSFNFAGFLAPAGEPPTLNLVTRGSLVPIRWQLPPGHGGFVSNPASFTSATVASLSCGSATAVPYGDTASGQAGISFDAATNAFVYNWQTGASWTGCRKLTIKLRDNSLHELRFRFQ